MEIRIDISGVNTNDGDDSIHVNGKNGPVIHLYYQHTYFFCVEQDDNSDHTFILTNSPYGGSQAKMIYDGFEPISKGCVCFKVGKCTLRYFFYQCTKHACEGGLVIVHDPNTK